VGALEHNIEFTQIADQYKVMGGRIQEIAPDIVVKALTQKQ